jgi:hypothetical protein
VKISKLEGEMKDLEELPFADPERLQLPGIYWKLARLHEKVAGLRLQQLANLRKEKNRILAADGRQQVHTVMHLLLRCLL